MRANVLFCLLVLSRGVFGASEVVPLQERAQGQSLVGSHQLNDSLYSNPAASAFTSTYSIEGSYLGPRTFAVSVLDTKTSTIGGGLGYFRAGSQVSDDVSQGLKLALATRLTESIAFGLGGKLVWGKGPAGDSRTLKDLDAGLLFDLSVVQLGASLRNVFGGDFAVLGQDREVAVGGRINYEQVLFLSVATQAKANDFNPYQVGVGVEYVSPYSFSVKAGYRIQPRASLSFWSAGASVSSTKFGIHYAIEFPAQGNTTPLHALSLVAML